MNAIYGEDTNGLAPLPGRLVKGAHCPGAARYRACPGLFFYHPSGVNERRLKRSRTHPGMYKLQAAACCRGTDTPIIQMVRLFGKIDITCWSAKNGELNARNWKSMETAPSSGHLARE